MSEQNPRPELLGAQEPSNGELLPGNRELNSEYNELIKRLKTTANLHWGLNLETDADKRTFADRDAFNSSIEQFIIQNNLRDTVKISNWQYSYTRTVGKNQAPFLEGITDNESEIHLGEFVIRNNKVVLIFDSLSKKFEAYTKLILPDGQVTWTNYQIVKGRKR